MNTVIVKAFCKGYIKGAVGMAIVGTVVAGTTWLRAEGRR